MKTLSGYFLMAIVGSIIAVPVTVVSCLVCDAIDNLITAKE